MEKELQFEPEINAQAIEKLRTIDSFSRKWSEIEKKKGVYLKELYQTATINSVSVFSGSLPLADIEKIIKGTNPHHFYSKEEQIAAGYYAALKTIHEDYLDILLSGKNILYLHKLLMKFSLNENQGKSNLPGNEEKSKNQKNILSAAGIHNTIQGILKLIEWADNELKVKRLHPLVIIGSFLNKFLLISPFREGNDRLSCLLTYLLLMQHEYTFIKYIPLAAQAQNGGKNEDTDRVLSFLEYLEDSVNRLAAAYQQYQNIGPYLNERQKRIKTFIHKNAPVGLADLRKTFFSVSEPTLKKDLQYLTNQNLVQRVGQSRGTLYIRLAEQNN